MNTTIIKDKHLKLDQNKIDRAKQILNTKTETETIERALEIVIHKNSEAEGRKKVVKRILNRRAKMKPVSGDASEWIREAREERVKHHGF
jgi:hypothetical protein